MKFKELEPVVVKTDHPEAGICAGDLGTVVAVYRKTRGLEVEFFGATGQTRSVVTLSPQEVRRAQRSDVLAVRKDVPLRARRSGAN